MEPRPHFHLPLLIENQKRENWNERDRIGKRELQLSSEELAFVIYGFRIQCLDEKSGRLSVLHTSTITCHDYFAGKVPENQTPNPSKLLWKLLHKMMIRHSLAPNGSKLPTNGNDVILTTNPLLYRVWILGWCFHWKNWNLHHPNGSNSLFFCKDHASECLVVEILLVNR